MAILLLSAAFWLTLPTTTMLLVKIILVGFRDFCLFAAGIVILVSAILELIFAPMAIFKYYMPAMFRSTGCLLVFFFYLVCVLVQMFNFLASLCLFVSTFLIGSNEKILSYDTANLISASLSFSLVMHRVVTQMDIYESVVQRDIYLEVSRVGDIACHPNGKCQRTDVFKWHQVNRCCGWDSAEDLFLVEQGNGLGIPLFCCDFNMTTNWRTSSCKLSSVNRFKKPCRSKQSLFATLRSYSLITHPCSMWYATFKALSALTYTLVKKSYLIAKSEGLYSFYLSA